MHIDMPAPQKDFTSPRGSNTNNAPYIIASMPSPSQNPHNATWASSPSTHHHHHHIHIPTPHPLPATASFLDKHVPLFAKHHTEFSVNHEARAAKREARRSLVDTAIPEVDAEHLPPPTTGSVIATAIHAATATGAGPALADSRAADNAAWREILAKREAARRRSGSDELRGHDSIVEEGSDSDSREYKGSPAVTP